MWKRRCLGMTWMACWILSGCTTPGTGGDSGVPFVPERVCNTGQAWNPAGTTPAYRETTADWGLSAARARSLSTADFDNDGYADLLMALNAGARRSNFTATPPVYNVRLMMNRPRPGGGRMFVDNTEASGLFKIRAGGDGRVVDLYSVGDVDNDGDVDVYTGVSIPATDAMEPGDRAEVMLNDGHGVFTFAPESEAQQSIDDKPQMLGAVFTDQNRDGVLDLWQGFNYDPYSNNPVGQFPKLMRGDGAGGFLDVAMDVGINLSATLASFRNNTNSRALYGVSTCDVNGDGRQDLLGATYGRGLNLYYESNADGTYTERGIDSKIASDGNTDYSDDFGYRCYCKALTQPDPAYCPPSVVLPPDCSNNPRGWTRNWDDQPHRLGGVGFGFACGDVDNDGDMDLYYAAIKHPDVSAAADVSHLLTNNGSTSAVQFTHTDRMALGLMPGIDPQVDDEGGLSPAMLDFDGDGRLDIILGLSDYPTNFMQVFLQKSDGTFQEVARKAGLRQACPHGFALGDFDNDGDMDMIVGSSTARTCANTWRNGPEVHFYENVLTDRNWTEVRLVGRGMGGSNRSGLGARVKVTAGGITQTREITAAFGHNNMSHDLIAHFGLGTACDIEKIEVRWLDAQATTQEFRDVRANHRIEIHQGESTVLYQRNP